MIPFFQVVKHTLQLQLHVIYLVIHAIYSHVQGFYIRYRKTHQVGPGQVRFRSILFRYKLDPEEISRPQDFVLSLGYVDTVDVLDNPYWHLYCVDKDRVLFVLLPRPATEYGMDKYAFMFVPVYEQVLFTNTARCGSTLLGKMLHRPGHSICFGEPHALCNLAIALGEETIPENEVKELLQATVTCLRAHLPENAVCILKTTSGEARLVPLCNDIPNMKHIFMFREKALFSVEKMVKREESLYTMLLHLYLLCPRLSRFIGCLMAAEGPWIRKLQPDTMRLWAGIIYASPYSVYLKHKDQYCHPVVWFHDVINDTQSTLEKLFEAVSIPSSCIADAIKCKEVDSQKNSFLSSSKLQHVQILPLDDIEYTTLHRYAVAMQLPINTFDV